MRFGFNEAALSIYTELGHSTNFILVIFSMGLPADIANRTLDLLYLFCSIGLEREKKIYLGNKQHSINAMRQHKNTFWHSHQTVTPNFCLKIPIPYIFQF